MARPEVVASERATYLYQMVTKSGEHLKYGISYNPLTRYSAKHLRGLGNARLRIIGQGQRPDMLRLERALHETLPIGSEEAQAFYRAIQQAKGLTP